MALCGNGLGDMDELSLQFAKENALRQVNECTDLEALKDVTRSLIQGHFEARALIGKLRLQGIPRTDSCRNT
jgi:hypothetical protein